MHSPALHSLLVSARGDELRRAAADAQRAFPRRYGAKHARLRRVRRAAPLPTIGVAPAVTIRYAFPDDAFALARLAALDSSYPPRGPVLLCELDGELCAALSLLDGGSVADPFRATTALLALLTARADQLRAHGVVSGRWALRWPGRAAWHRRGGATTG